MPGGSRCFVPYCDTGRKGCIEKRTVFSVPRVSEEDNMHFFFKLQSDHIVQIILHKDAELLKKMERCRA
jgi:hypothetical protein